MDWLGTGLSGRPEFRAQGRQEAEDFFVESLDKWRIEMGLEKFILLGHSIGGYLSACYALKHPEVGMVADSPGRDLKRTFDGYLISRPQTLSACGTPGSGLPRWYPGGASGLGYKAPLTRGWYAPDSVQNTDVSHSDAIIEAMMRALGSDYNSVHEARY